MSNEITGTIQSHNLIGQVGYQGGGSGSSDYNDLINKPSINGITLMEDKSLDELNIASIDDVKEVKSIVKGANQALSYEDYFEVILVFNSLSNDKYKIGQNIYIKTRFVPDLWVYSIEETNVPYTYIDDESLQNDLITNGHIQVGYYKLAPLETQKVDLTNYLEKVTDETNDIQVYAKNKDGTFTMLNAVQYYSNDRNGIVRYIGGNVIVNTPTEGAHATTKSYVDNNFVKNTDYASSGKAGLVRLGGYTGIGTGGLTDGTACIIRASNELIDTRHDNPSTQQYYNPIVPATLDYSIKAGLTTNKEEWTDEEKASARELINSAKNEVASTTYTGSGYIGNAGLFLFDGSAVGGLFKSTTGGNVEGAFRIKKAIHTDIDNRTPSNYHDAGIGSANHCCPIVPANIDYAVKAVLTNPKIEWTDEEKQAFKSWIGL